MTESDTRPKSNKRTVILIAFAVVASISTVFGYKYFSSKIIAPVTSLHNLQLGMREVDATLVYGRNPDCDGREDEFTKELVFHGRKECGTSLTFHKKGGTTTLANICENDGFAPILIENFRGDYHGNDESAILRNLGDPSDVSISRDGTSKVLNFSKYNVAFAMRRGNVEVYCVTRDLPLVFTEEYEPSAVEG